MHIDNSAQPYLLDLTTKGLAILPIHNCAPYNLVLNPHKIVGLIKNIKDC
jgi:hypothetical protein